MRVQIAPPRRAVERLSAVFDRLPIRVRLAGVSALLTFVILCVFAVAVGSLTTHRIRSDFDHQVETTAAELPSELSVDLNPSNGRVTAPGLATLAAGGGSIIKLLLPSGEVIQQTPANAPSLGTPNLGAPVTRHGYRIVSHTALVRNLDGVFGQTVVGQIVIQYARDESGMKETIARVELFLVLGVFAATALALLAGAAIARRAMAPIAQLTNTAAEIARTRDPSAIMPQPEADDEVGELARTLQSMLRELHSAHAETETMLARQRRFIADASHELRTPLTSVLANLELLAETLVGEQGEAARGALRSSRRMRRLVADLLLLARTDVGRVVAHEPLDLAQVVVEATAELGPISADHEVSLEVQPVTVDAAGDELHRLVINLLENALRHTPPGTRIWVSTEARARQARLIVEDDGPGIPEGLRQSLFERFVRGAGDRGGSFGLGLAIVRAVAESHGGEVTVERTSRDEVTGGARFVVCLPRAIGSQTRLKERLTPAPERV